ncbi:hypothetical protein RF11_00324 [Thelohanellus kitauei]|uniref:Uncharacterized protein n=1 Tax=Thelohanellus kitauei TaxID=669202 RepID=A0A0C2JG10_THEKT|nr:hypothetical protein RF11_00324 [Thelohanellus kitauei]
MLSIKWNYLGRNCPVITTADSHSLIGKNVGLWKRLSDRVPEVDSNSELILFRCIIHQGVKTNHWIGKKGQVVNYSSQKRSAEFDILSWPFISDFEKATGSLQMELIDMHRDSTIEEKFQSEAVDKFYASNTESKFCNLRTIGLEILFLFGST